jgi:hypothetical protein
MKRFYGRKMIGHSVTTALLLIGCDGNNGVNPDKPEFGNVTALGGGKIYVAYLSPTARKQKLDTVTVSFEYNSSKAKSIFVKATIDSGKTWLPVATIAPNGSNVETVRWIPKNSSIVAKFFGVKRCFIRIADTVTNAYIDTDTFPLVGAVPMVLLNSLDNDTFRMNDTIKVQYGANMDLASNIQTYFKTDSMEDWVEFVNDSKLPSPDSPTILNKQKCLILASVDSMVKIEAHNFAQPIRILLRDYSSSDLLLITGYITILAAPRLE